MYASDRNVACLCVCHHPTIRWYGRFAMIYVLLADLLRCSQMCCAVQSRTWNKIVNSFALNNQMDWRQSDGLITWTQERVTSVRLRAYWNQQLGNCRLSNLERKLMKSIFYARICYVKLKFCRKCQAWLIAHGTTTIESTCDFAS